MTSWLNEWVYYFVPVNSAFLFQRCIPSSTFLTSISSELSVSSTQMPSKSDWRSPRSWHCTKWLACWNTVALRTLDSLSMKNIMWVVMYSTFSSHASLTCHIWLGFCLQQKVKKKSVLSSKCLSDNCPSRTWHIKGGALEHHVHSFPVGYFCQARSPVQRQEVLVCL